MFLLEENTFLAKWPKPQSRLKKPELAIEIKNNLRLVTHIKSISFL